MLQSWRRIEGEDEDAAGQDQCLNWLVAASVALQQSTEATSPTVHRMIIQRRSFLHRRRSCRDLH